MHRRTLAILIAVSVALASCVPPLRTVVENESGLDVAIWPLSRQPIALPPGVRSSSVPFAGYVDNVALIGARGCLYTYRRPIDLPRILRGLSPRIVVVVADDLALHIHEMTKEGERGEELIGSGLPLVPTRFCGAPG